MSDIQLAEDANEPRHAQLGEESGSTRPNLKKTEDLISPMHIENVQEFYRNLKTLRHGNPGSFRVNGGLSP